MILARHAEINQIEFVEPIKFVFSSVQKILEIVV